jgi:hypothetical protein
MKPYFALPALILFFIAQQGCTSTGKMHCPDLASQKKPKPSFMVRMLTGHEHNKHHGDQNDNAIAANASVKPTNEIPGEKIIKIKIPTIAAKRLQEQDINDVNVYFKSQAQSGISMVREQNKVYLEAKSPAGLLKIAQSMAFSKEKPAAAPGGGGGGMAIAAGVLGIVGFLLAFGPFIGFGALLCALLAIILGAISLGSSRRGWAITGIVLGAVTLAVAILFIRVVYFHFL